MKIYLAAPWSDKDQMPAMAEKIEGAGHEITHKWWEVEDKADYSHAEKRIHAALDLTGVMRAQVVILVNSKKSEGKAVEQGVALADDKTIIAIGKRGEHSKNVFHWLENYKWVETLEEGLEWLQMIGSPRGV